jgi:hypothetical protein
MFRFSRIATAFLVLILAWNFGQYLFDGLSLIAPSIGELLVQLMPQNVSGHDTEFWGKFIVSILLFWIGLKLFGLVFGFATPKAQQFGTTKLVRRFQGLCAELTLIGGIFSVFILTTAMKEPEVAPVQAPHLWPSDTFSDRPPSAPPAGSEPPTGLAPPIKPSTGLAPPLVAHPEDYDPNRKGGWNLPKEEKKGTGGGWQWQLQPPHRKITPSREKGAWGGALSDTTTKPKKNRFEKLKSVFDPPKEDKPKQ